MKIKEMLSNEVAKQLDTKKQQLKKDEEMIKKSKRRRNKKKQVKKDPLKEKMSTGFIKSLMGMDRPTYYKSSGSWKQR